MAAITALLGQPGFAGRRCEIASTSAHNLAEPTAFFGLQCRQFFVEMSVVLNSGFRKLIADSVGRETLSDLNECSASKTYELVGTGRFELPTPRTPSECSTRLSHVPTLVRSGW